MTNRIFDNQQQIGFYDFYKYSKDARWDVVGKALKTMEDGFVAKSVKPLEELGEINGNCSQNMGSIHGPSQDRAMCDEDTNS